MVKLLRMKMMLLLLWMVGAGTSAFGAEMVYKTALFGSSYNSKGVSAYTTTFTATNNEFTVSLTNFNNNNNGWNFVKCGSKSSASTGTITTSAAIDKAITKVVVTIDAITTSSNVTSIKLYTSSDNTTWTEVGSFDKSAGAKEVSLSTPAANLYYKLEFVCTKGSSNGLVTVSKVEYYINESIDPIEPTIVVADDNVTFGSNYTVDDSVIEGGTISVTSSNTNVATVEGLVITPVAVGKTTITVSTAQNDYYLAGSETFTLTVTQPAGQTTAPVGTIKTTFTNKGLDYEEGGIAWTADKEANQFEKTGDARGVQFGSAIGKFTLTASNTDEITKVSMVLSTNAGTNSVAVKVGNTDFKSDDVKTLSLTNGMKNETVEFIGTGTGSVVISFNDETKSIYVKSITLTKAVDEPAVTFNASGFATFCSEYPLDFSEAEGYTAWQITKIDTDNKITFEQITGSVKGGTGIFLKGEAGATVTLTSADSSNELDGNMLEGTLAPTYVETGKYYGLSGDSFVKVNAGTVPAGKALIDADWISENAGARFTFVFTESTGIETVKTTMGQGKVFDLQGRRVYTPGKGMYIVDGKKMIMK